MVLPQVGNFAVFCVLVMGFGTVKLGKALVYGKYLYNAPPQDRGVLIAVDQTAFWGLATLGTFSMGWLVDTIGLTQTILAVSGTILFGTLVLAARGHLIKMTPA